MKPISRTDLLNSMLGSEFVFDQQGIYSDYSGVASPKLFTQGQFFSKQEFISQLYLLNFENSHKMGPIYGTTEYMANPANIALLYENRYNENCENIILLPKPRKIKISLGDVLCNRVSSRYFDGSKILLQDLSDFLFYSVGSIASEKEVLEGVTLQKNRRSYPSGGGMYSTRIFICAYNVENIEKGIYLYQPVSHSLSFWKDICDLDEFIITEHYDISSNSYRKIENQSPSAFLINVNNFNKQRIKYSELSLLLALTDNGCIMQNFSLLASALNMHYCVWAGFKKANTERVLGIDGQNEHVIMTSLLGGKK